MHYQGFAPLPVVFRTYGARVCYSGLFHYLWYVVPMVFLIKLLGVSHGLSY